MTVTVHVVFETFPGEAFETEMISWITPYIESGDTAVPPPAPTSNRHMYREWSSEELADLYIAKLLSFGSIVASATKV